MFTFTSRSRCLVSLGLLQHVAAEILSLGSLPLPPSNSYHLLHTFRVDSFEGSLEEVPPPKPSVDFKNLIITPNVNSLGQEGDRFPDVQLNLVSLEDIQPVQHQRKMCSEVTLDYDSNEKYRVLIQAHGRTSAAIFMNKTGTYALVTSNCGKFSDGMISGSIEIKYAHGYIPSNQYSKMVMYRWLWLFYAGLGLMWLALCLRRMCEVFRMHYCIGAVIFFAFLEALLWFALLHVWNTTGTRPKALLVFVIIYTVVTSALSYMLMLLAAIGLGTTRSYLEQRDQRKVRAMAIFYVILDLIRQSVLLCRHSYSLSLSQPLVLLGVLPGVLLNIIIFYWILSSLLTSAHTLRSGGQQDLSIVFERLRQAWTLAIVVMSLATVIQIYLECWNINLDWHYEWLFPDGVSHMLFLSVLLVVMYHWAPHSSTSVRYASLPTSIADEKVAEIELAHPDVWDDEDAGDDADDDQTFWTSVQEKGELDSSNGVQADKVGAAAL